MAVAMLACSCLAAPVFAQDPIERPLPPIAAPEITETPALPPVDCTITGTPGPDRLVGTSGDDVICGRGGNDVILGRGGDDVIVGGGGRDQVFGGKGDDVIRGGKASDVLDGGNGTDQLDGGPGSDTLRGGHGTNGCLMDPADSATSDCVSDTTGPVSTIGRVPASVEAGTEVTVSWRLSDPAGVAMSWMSIGGRQGWAGWCVAKEAALEAGDRFVGLYTATCSVPESVINDTFGVWVNSVDALGNGVMQQEIAQFTVTGGSDDLDAPTVNLISFDAGVGAGEEFTVTWQASDSSGVGFTYLYLRNLSGPRIVTIGLGTLIDGDLYSGTYQATLMVQEDMMSGTYELYQWSGDPVNNRTVTSFGSVQFGG